MKNQFVIITVIFAAMMSAFLCSCNKEEQKKTDPEPAVDSTEVKFLYAILDGQDKVIEHSFDFDVNGVAKTVRLSDMAAVDSITFPSFYENVDKAYRFLKEKSFTGYKVYAVTLGKLTKGQKVSEKSINLTLKADRPASDTVDLMIGHGIVGLEKKVWNGVLSEVTIHKGVFASEFENFVAIINKGTDFKHIYICK